MNMDEPGFQSSSIQCNKYSWRAYCVQSITQDVKLNGFCPEAYTFIRGLERILSTQGGHSKCRRKMKETMSAPRREGFCEV
jgi:hypothetical protein